MIPRAIATINVEDYVQIDYFEYRVDKEGRYRCPQDVYLKPDNVDTYYPLAEKDAVLTWAEITTLLDTSLTGRLYRRRG